jgi:hypothetical protein
MSGIFAVLTFFWFTVYALAMEYPAKTGSGGVNEV